MVAPVVSEPPKKSKTISFLSVESSKTRLIKSSGLGLVKTSDPNICRKCLVADVFVLVYIIHGMRKSKTADTFYCGMFNGIYLNPESVEDLKLSLWDYMTKDDGFTGSRNTDRMYFETFNDGYEDNILIDGNYDKKRFDVIIANEETYKIYAGNGQAIDLKEILNPELLDKIGNDIVTTTNNELGKTGSYGIKINKEILPLYNKDGEEYESTVLFVIKNTTRLDAAVEFIKYLYRN